MEKAMPATRPPFNEAANSQTDIKERFYRYFQQEVTELQDQMSQLHNFASVERKDAADHCLAGIGRLNSEVTDATDFLPAYDQRTYSQAIKALTEQLQETRAKLAPKARFQFKTTHKNDSAVSISDAANLAAATRFQFRGFAANLSSAESSIATTPAHLMTPSPGLETDSVGDLPSFPKNYNEEMSKSSSTGGPIRKPSFSQATNVNISGHTGLHIILPSSASRATSSGSVTKLERCILDMSIPTANGAPFAGIMLKNIKRSLIIAGQVAGAAHITGVEDSIIVVTSRQVRMHDCKNVDVYLHVASRPIIEDCTNVRFSPIPDCYAHPEIEVENQWDQVDDFKWLKAEHSPNWSILPRAQRLKEDIWTETVPGGPGAGLDDILKEVKIL